MSINEKIWIVGAKGRIGRYLVKHLNPLDYQIIATDKEDVDITNLEDVIHHSELYEPYAIINVAAYTDPQLCQLNPHEAFKVNSLGARNLAIAANQLNIKLIHFSTDDIFEGTENIELLEYDLPTPQSEYGKSKLRGEEFIRQFSDKYFILRSSWVYDTITIRTVLRALDLGHLILSGEQISSPTSVSSLCKIVPILLNSLNFGTYHVSTDSSVSRYGFVEEIAKICNKSQLLDKLEIEEVHNSLRPQYSILNNYMLKMTGIYEMPHWKKDLENFIKENKVVIDDRKK